MEYFPAASEDQWSYIQSLIDDCDYYIVVVAGRYGSINSKGISYTQQEYEYAVSKEIPVIAFVHGKSENLPAKFIEKSPQSKKKLEELKVVKSRLCKYWKHLMNSER